jgi:hypothetical protein
VARDLGGRVFLSHASEDKELVRQLQAALDDADFQSWLDERELVPGDNLPQEIARAVHDAAAVVLFISEASARSEWLRYELRIATERAVNGSLLVIPARVDDTEIPPEAAGLVYADFRGPFEDGAALVVKALEQAAERREAERPLSFGRRVEAQLRAVFDSIGWTSFLGEYKDLDYDSATIANVAGEDVEVAYDVVNAWSDRDKPLSARFVEEFLEVSEEWLAKYAMLISERPIGTDHPELEGSGGRVQVIQEPLRGHDRGAASGRRTARLARFVALVDASSDLPDAELQALLRSVRDVIADTEAEERSPTV